MVLTLFDGAAAPPWSHFTEKLLAAWGNPPDIRRLRRAEDEAALAKLGAANLAAGILEAHYRCGENADWLYLSLDALLGPVHAADGALTATILDYLRMHFELCRYTIVSPLAIGNHVDHQVTFAAAEELVKAGQDVMFYEDFPYAARSTSYAERMSVLSGLEPVLIESDRDAMMAKIEALSYYRSQIPSLFRDANNMAVELIDFARRTGGAQAKYGERFWRVADRTASLATGSGSESESS